MAISSSSSSSSSDSEVQKCSKQCLDSFKTLQKNYDTEREKHNKAKLEIRGYEIALESLESRILGHEKNELAWGEKYEFQNYELKCREIKINNLNLELEKAVKERDELKDKIAKWEESTKNLEEILKSQMSARDKTGLGYSTQLNELSSNHETDSENSLSIFEGRSSDDEHIPENDRFSKKGKKLYPHPSTGNFLPPEPEYLWLVSESVVSNPKINRDSVIIEDWTSDDEEEVSGVQKVRLENQTVKTRDDKSGQNSHKQGVGFRKVKACFVCRSTEHLIKDCNFHDKKSQESNLKNVVNTGKWESKPVWDNTKRVNHPNFSKYPHLSETFVPTGVSSRTGLHRPSINNARTVCIARPSINTARPVSTVMPSISTARPIYTVRPIISTVRPIYASRSIYPRMDNVRPRCSYSPIKRSYYTKPAFRPKDLKQYVKTFGVKNMTTAGKRAVVNTGKGKLDTDLKRSKWVWRPKGTYLNDVSKDNGSFMLKKVEADPVDLLQDHAVVDSGCSSHMTSNKAYLSDYEDFNRGFVAFGSDPKGGKSPSISFMRPFGCSLTILNTLDSLGKFDGKSDEGYLLGYSTSSKAFRVYNKRTKRVEENLHINFLKDQPNVAGTGPNWMFDLDFLTNSMNYIPVSVENQVNVDAGTQDSYVAGSSGKDKGPTQEYILLPLQPHRTRIPVKDVVQVAQEKPSENASPDKDIQDSEDAADKEEQHQMQDNEKDLQDELEMFAQAISTNQLSTDRSSVNTNRPSSVSTNRSNTLTVSTTSTSTGANANGSSFVYLRGKIPIDASTLPNANLPIDPNIPALEDVSDTLPNDRIFNGAYDDDEDVGAEADFNNIDNTIACPNKSQGAFRTVVCMFLSQEEPRLYHKPYKDESWLKQSRELLQSNCRRFGYFVDLPSWEKRDLAIKWFFRNKRDERRGDNKPPMLEKHLYDSWKSRMELYMLNRPHGRMILASVEKGPLVWPSITVEGVTRLKEYTELTPAEAIQADCDIKAINIILQGLPTEIYALVSQHRVAKDLWEKIKLLMQGTSLTKQERECKLYDEFDKFTYKKGESLHEYYLRFTLLLNDMNIYKMPLEQFQVNTKFLNTLPNEWSKFVTDVKLVKDLHTTNVDQLHAYLQQHERHANEVRLMHERNSDPLTLVASHQLPPSTYQSHLHTLPNSQLQHHVSPYPSSQFVTPYQTQQFTTSQSTPLSITYPSNEYQSSVHHNVYSPQSSIPQLEYAPTTYQHQQSEFSQPDSGLIVPVFQKGDNPIDAINHMMSFLTAVVTSRYLTTNNQLRTSSNPLQQATIYDGKVTVQPVQGRQTTYAAGTTRKYTPGASGSNTGKQRTVICYNCKGEGHISKQYLGLPDTQTSQTVITHNAAYKSNDLDPYDFDCDELNSAKITLMANLSRNGSDALTEVHNPDNLAYDLINQSEQIMTSSEQSNDVN
ncbi:retrovirus-related pol polyprotein from transposon TNT 1-94 [Tanacetum coccineum]